MQKERKKFNRIQHAFMPKILRRTGIEKKFLKLIKNSNNDKTIANITPI